MEDSYIIRLYFDRNEEAIGATATKYGNYCTAIAKNILGTAEDAEECVNDTYLKTWNTIPPQNPHILSAFLGKITRNLAFNRYKHQCAQKRGGGELSLVFEELAGCISEKDPTQELYDCKSLSEDINAFLETLPLRKRQIFVRRYFYTDSLDVIGRESGLSYSNLVMTLSRLRKKLRVYLIKRGYNI